MSFEQFKSVADKFPEAMLLVCSQGEILAVNRLACQYLGRDQEYLIHEKLCHLVGVTHAEVVDRLRPCSRSRIPIPLGLRFDSTSGRNDAHIGVEAFLFTPATDSSQAEIVLRLKRHLHSPTQFSALKRELLEINNALRSLSRSRESLRLAKESAETASRAKSDFLAMMSHELRTPLNSILGSLDLLHDTVLDTEQYEYVGTSRHSTELLLYIVNNILAFSSAEAGEITLDSVVFPVFGIVDHVVQLSQMQASETGVSLCVEIDPKVPKWARGGATAIQQVLLNLVGNGVKYTPVGEVRISVSLLGQSENAISLRFMVSDTGEGIAEEDKGRIFEEFWSHTGIHKQWGTGVGLGLAIAHRLVRVLGGTIHFDSRLGAGSRFWFDIPLVAVSLDSGLEEQLLNTSIARTTPEVEVRLRGRILVAEDNTANQMVIQAMLRRLGLSVEVAGNGLEALEALRHDSYDLILMDINMPQMDGREATRAIRALGGPKASVPIVAYTAHLDSKDRKSLLCEGFDDCVAKPIDRAGLANCLAKWLVQGAER